MAENHRVGAAQDPDQRTAAPRPSLACSIRPGISTSCTSTPSIRVNAGTGRVVVKG